MSPIDTSGIKPGPRFDTERLDTRVRGGNSEQTSTSDAKRADSVQLTDTAAKLAELQAEVAAADGVDLNVSKRFVSKLLMEVTRLTQIVSLMH